MATTYTNGVINNGLPGSAMRRTMECKGLLEAAGSIYCGTGEKEEHELVDGNGQTQTYEIPVTAALNPPATAGTYVLQCTVDANGGVTLNWVAAS